MANLKSVEEDIGINKKKTFTAQRAEGYGLDKKVKKILDAPRRKPADPIEHFRHIKCEKGHSNWDPANVKYSIDHRAFIINCIDCEEYFVVPAGGVQPIEVPAEVVR